MNSRQYSVVFLDAGSLPRPLQFDAALPVVYDAHDATDADQVAARIADADVVVTNKTRLGAEQLEQAGRLRLIVVAAAGTDNVDTQAAERLGIDVRNVPDYGSDSVAEHVIATLFMLRRALGSYAQAAVDGRWSDATHFCWHGPVIRGVGGRTFGVVGRGRIGEATAALARGLGMRVLFARTPGQPCAEDERELDQLFREVDALTPHVPLTPQTSGLVNAQRLASMKPTAVLINTGRGALVDAQALVEALRSGRIAGAAIDVLDTEPPPRTHPLLAGDVPNLLLTPHVAWASESAQASLASKVSALVDAHLRARAEACE
ncbi:MAG: glycerate dehydrogenase [Azoarcus sp.]|nr:glycerate dehydrogenase [Azoarcus sp.]